MKKWFKIVLVIAVNLHIILIVASVVTLFMEAGFRLSRLHLNYEESILLLGLLLLYISSSIFQVKTFLQYPNYSSNSNNKIFDGKILDVQNDEEWTINPEKIKLPTIIWIGNFIVSFLSLALSAVLLNTILINSAPHVWLNSLLTLFFLLLGISLLVDMVMVWRINK